MCDKKPKTIEQKYQELKSQNAFGNEVVKGLNELIKEKDAKIATLELKLGKARKLTHTLAKELCVI